MDHDSVFVTMDKEELLPLCESNDDLEGKPPQNPVPRRWEGHKSIRLFPWPLILIHAAFILAYTVAFFVLVSAETPMSSLVYSPAREALRYMPKTVSVLYNDTTNLFLQESGEGVEEAWYQLLQNLNIRMTENEMLALGRESVRLSDGSGDSLVSLDVYHQLHCLKFLRDYVDGGPIPSLRVAPKNHAYHCIELLRQIIQCHGDISVLTYDWLPNDNTPMPRWKLEHDCVDWNALDTWAAGRRVSLSGAGIVIHPALGDSYHSVFGVNGE